MLEEVKDDPLDFKKRNVEVINSPSMTEVKSKKLLRNPLTPFSIEYCI